VSLAGKCDSGGNIRGALADEPDGLQVEVAAAFAPSTIMPAPDRCRSPFRATKRPRRRPLALKGDLHWRRPMAGIMIKATFVTENAA